MNVYKVRLRALVSVPQYADEFDVIACARKILDLIVSAELGDFFTDKEDGSQRPRIPYEVVSAKLLHEDVKVFI